MKITHTYKEFIVLHGLFVVSKIQQPQRANCSSYSGCFQSFFASSQSLRKWFNLKEFQSLTFHVGFLVCFIMWYIKNHLRLPGFQNYCVRMCLMPFSRSLSCGIFRADRKRCFVFGKPGGIRVIWDFVYGICLWVGSVCAYRGREQAASCANSGLPHVFCVGHGMKQWGFFLCNANCMWPDDFWRLAKELENGTGAITTHEPGLLNSLLYVIPCRSWMVMNPLISGKFSRI